MRLNILVLALLSSAASAHAGSVDVITTGKDAVRSIERIRCAACVRTVVRKSETVVELAPGTQKIEIREIDGVKKVYRTEAWLGGSPVVFVSKALPDEAPALADGQDMKADDLAAAPEASTELAPLSADANMIDEKSTTSAVAADMGAEAKVEPAKPAFDPSKLELRLN